MEEILRTVKGMEDYSVTSGGRIWSKEKKVVGRWGNTRKRKGKWIKTYVTSNGYARVCLYENGKKKKFMVHRLVAEVWVPGYFEGAVVDHINNIKTDNNSSNLRWTTTQENAERGSAKHYLIRFLDGKPVPIYNLSKYCRNTGIPRNRLTETLNKHIEYRGMKLFEL